MNRKIEAVAAQGSSSKSRWRGSRGVADLTGLELEDEERCLASCPVDMAKASRLAPLVQLVDVHQISVRSAEDA